MPTVGITSSMEQAFDICVSSTVGDAHVNAVLAPYASAWAVVVSVLAQCHSAIATPKAHVLVRVRM